MALRALPRHRSTKEPEAHEETRNSPRRLVIGTAAYAQTTVIQKDDGLAGSRTIVKQLSVDDAAVVKDKKVITTGSTGWSQRP